MALLTALLSASPMLMVAQDAEKAKEGRDKVIQLRDGSYYKGETLIGMMPNGKGEQVWDTGDRYEGEFEKGKRHGVGTMYYVSGERYEGEWHENRQHGRGIYHYKNGDRFDGYFNKGVIHGFGTMYYANGDAYLGTWENGHRTGTGSYTWDSGNNYSGEWVDGRREGVSWQQPSPCARKSKIYHMLVSSFPGTWLVQCSSTSRMNRE